MSQTMDALRVSNREDHPIAGSDRRDRLSELPDSLTFAILSLLEMKDVVRTTILSKRWNDLWTAVPCLDFGDANPRFINGALAKWNGAKIFKFRIDLRVVQTPSTHMVDSWLLVPIRKQVEELHIDLGYYVGHKFSAPHPLYTCSSMTKFFLSNLQIEDNVRWNRLKSLTIEGMHIVSEDSMNRMLSGAPVLEELVLNLFEICGKFNIRSTSLKRLHIGKHDCRCIRSVENSVQKIQTPNLLTLEVSPLFHHDHCVFDIPSLATAILRIKETDAELFMGQFYSLKIFYRIFRSICRVEELTLSAWCTEYLLYMKMKNKVEPFSNAKFVELEASEARQVYRVLELFPNLMILKAKLDQCFRYSLIGDEIADAMVDARNSFPSLLQLKTVEISLPGFDIDISMIPFMEIQFLLENVHVLEKMVLRLGGCFSNRETYALVEAKVLSMPRSSPTAQVIINIA